MHLEYVVCRLKIRAREQMAARGKRDAHDICYTGCGMVSERGMVRHLPGSQT
ncbi:hypothetical protein [Candidatus Viridilinea mediisalina]|uniref:hypothetical protein n=1 Tax=Candidatus Viridilinea mediisalina TaxID=2024553 RepID=UPI0013FDDD39|nr:hypothetical protein [Candidatus Viridilinea mediisalina]